MKLPGFPVLGRLLVGLAAGLGGRVSPASAAPGSPPPATFRRVIPELARSRQLIVVRSRDWQVVPASIQRFERARAGAPWQPASPPFPGTLGRGGLAWGIGRHGGAGATGPGLKREGDGRAPAGVFGLVRAYGQAAPPGTSPRFPYTQLNERFEGIDDPRSRHYNRLIDPARVAGRDWSHSEKVNPDSPAYRWCVMVAHNWQRPYPGFGSCIYLHGWSGPGRPTSGCTAMAPAHVEALVRWLDAAKAPLLVQLPEGEYRRLRTAWSLP